MEIPKAANNNDSSEFENTNIEALEKYDTFISALNNADSIDAIKEALIEYAVETVKEMPELPNKNHWPSEKILISFSEENEGGEREWNGEKPLLEAIEVLNQLEQMFDSEGKFEASYLEMSQLISEINLIPVQGRLLELLYPKQDVDDTILE